MGWKLFAGTVAASLVLVGSASPQGGTSRVAAAQSKTSSQSGGAKTAAPSMPATHQISGTVVSSDASSLVISHKFSGKLQMMRFALSAQTKTSGKLEKGALTTVMYRIEAGKNIALSLRSRPEAPPEREPAVDTKTVTQE